jgi:hypothetical protein
VDLRVVDRMGRAVVTSAPGFAVPWLEGASPTRSSTLTAPPRNVMYQGGIIPPCECPTIETLRAPVAARTASTNRASWPAEVGMSPVPRSP